MPLSILVRTVYDLFTRRKAKARANNDDGVCMCV